MGQPQPPIARPAPMSAASLGAQSLPICRWSGSQRKGSKSARDVRLWQVSADSPRRYRHWYWQTPVAARQVIAAKEDAAGKTQKIYTAPPDRWDPVERQRRAMERDCDADLASGGGGGSEGRSGIAAQQHGRNRMTPSERPRNGRLARERFGVCLLRVLPRCARRSCPRRFACSFGEVPRKVRPTPLINHTKSRDVARQLDDPRRDPPLPLLQLLIAFDAHAEPLCCDLLRGLEHVGSPAAELRGRHGFDDGGVWMRLQVRCDMGCDRARTRRESFVP